MPDFFSNPAVACPLPELRLRLDFDDARLLGECRVETHRVSGPGGQHRNKTESAVRLTHKPSGLVVTGNERRSQHENKANALERLREAIALVARVRPESGPQWPQWPPNLEPRNGRLRVSAANPAAPHVLAIVLDAFAAHDADLKPAAEALGLTPSSLAKFAYDHPKVWRELQHMRSQAGRPPLRTPR